MNRSGTQLVLLGLSRAAVGRRAGRLRALQNGVYLVGPMEQNRAVEMAAVLAGGPAALLSHTNALHLWRRAGRAAATACLVEQQSAGP